MKAFRLSALLQRNGSELSLRSRSVPCDILVPATDQKKPSRQRKRSPSSPVEAAAPNPTSRENQRSLAARSPPAADSDLRSRDDQHCRRRWARLGKDLVDGR